MTKLSPPFLHIEKLHCRYGHRIVIDRISPPALAGGSLVALVGPNGSGKSSLLRAVAGLVPASASILRAGHTDLTPLSAAVRSNHLRYLPQSPPPALRLTVLECLRVRGRTHAGKSHSLLREARLHEQLDELNIAHLAHEWLDTLSGGQRQLVGLAQFLLDCPDVMLLDEPLSALDINYQQRVLECLKHRVRSGPALAVVVMHDLNMALQHADTVLVLHAGALVASGSTTTVFTPALLETVFGIRGRLIRLPEMTHPLLLAESLPQSSSHLPESRTPSHDHA